VLGASTLSPHASDGLALGTSSLMWSDLFLASGAVVNFNNGDVTLTHAANNLAINGGNLQYGDSVKAAFGNSGDFNIYHDATNSYIDNEVTGDLYIRQLVDDKDIIFQSDDGSGGVTAYLTLDGSESMIMIYKGTRFPDNISLQIGSSGDLLIQHDGTDSTITNTTGNLNFYQNTDDGDINFLCDDGSGGVTQYFRLDGGLSAPFTVFPDNSTIVFGNDFDLRLYHNGSHSYIDNTDGNLYVRNNKQNQDIIFQGDDGQASDSTVTTYFYLDGSSATHDGSATTALYTNWPDNSRISLGTSHDFRFQHNGSHSYIENLTGNLEIINYADDGDIIFNCDDGSGGTTAYLTLDGSAGFTTVQKLIKFEDNVHARFGNGSDLRILHDGSNSERRRQ